MTPKKIIIYTRAVQVHFHVALARRLAQEFPQAEVLFISFFSQAVEIARAEGYNAIHFPKALQELSGKRITEERIAEIDAYCRSEYVGLNAMLQMERFLPQGRERAEAFMVDHLTLLDELIEPETLSVSSMYDHFIYVAAGMLAFEKGGAHFAFVGCGVPGGRVIGLKTPWETWCIEGGTEDPSELFSIAQAEITKPSEDRIDYMRKLPSREESLTFGQRIGIARRLAQFTRKDLKAGSYFTSSSGNWAWNAIRWRYKTWLQCPPEDVWDVRDVCDLKDLKAPCVFLALHMEPEATIYMYSPRWRDQLEVCRLVSEALPLGWVLLVKENPRMIGVRQRGYYEKLRRFSNVMLVSTSVPSPELIEKSEAVVSLAGTVTVEARLRGRRAYCFGRPPFHRLANATGTDLLDELKNLKSASPDHRFIGSSQFSGADEAWARWIRGTFIGKGGKSVYRSEIGQCTWDASHENVCAHVDFIRGSLPSRSA